MRWYNATVKYAGLGSIYPGKNYKPIYVRKLPHRSLWADKVEIISLNKNEQRRETFTVRVAVKCLKLGRVAAYQQMINRKYKQLWGQ